MTGRRIQRPATADPLKLRGLELVQRFEKAPGNAYSAVWSVDGSRLAATGRDVVAVWSAAGGRPRLMRGHSPGAEVFTAAWHPSGSQLATAAGDKTVRLWEMDTRRSRILCRLDNSPIGLGWSPDGQMLAVADRGGGLGIWDVNQRTLVRRARIHEGCAYRPCWSPDGQLVITGGQDRIISVQTADDLRVQHRMYGHTGTVFDIDLSPRGDRVASAGQDQTVRVWDLDSGRQIVALEGHTSMVTCVRFSLDGEFLVSGANDDSVRLWRCRDWECVATLQQEHFKGIGGLDFHPHRPLLAVKDWLSGRIDCYRVDFDLLLRIGPGPGSRRYVNAKVVLVGDSGVGKSGLWLVLAGQPYRATDSTHARNVCMFDTQEVKHPSGGEQAREVLLWDLAGQPGYRLVHQLHLNEVAVALVVFDSRNETDPFSGVKHWVRSLAQARRVEGEAAVRTRMMLVAARADRGGVGVTRERVRAVLQELGFDQFFETSAKARVPQLVVTRPREFGG